MAKIAEKILVVKLSKLIRTDDEDAFDLPEELVPALEQFVSEMISDNAMIVEASEDE